MDSKYIFILLTCLIFAATDAQKVNRKKRQTWGGGGADKVSNSVGSKGRSPVKDLTSGDQINSFFNPEQTSFTYKSGGADQISNSVGSKGKSQLKDLPSRGLQLNSFFKPEQTVFKYKPVAKSSSLSAPTKQNTIAKPKKNLSGSTKSSGNGNSISNNNSGKRQGNGLTNWSGSRTQSQNTWGTFTTTSRPRFNWRRNNFPRQNGFTGMGGGRSGGGWSNNNNNFPGMGGLQNMFAAASGHFMGDQQRMEAAIMAGTFARPLGGMSFDKTFDRSPPKIIPYGCPPGARQFVCTGFNPCEVGPCRRYPSARCWVNACGGCSPEWWTHTFQRVMDCD